MATEVPLELAPGLLGRPIDADHPLEQVVTLLSITPECQPMKDKPMVSRRIFLETAGAATGAAVAASAFPHPAIGGVYGANERIGVPLPGRRRPVPAAH